MLPRNYAKICYLVTPLSTNAVNVRTILWVHFKMQYHLLALTPVLKTNISDLLIHQTFSPPGGCLRLFVATRGHIFG